MYFKQKLAYMALGCLFTIIGYILASLGSDVDVQAQGDKSEPNVQEFRNIVCDRLMIRDGGSISTRPKDNKMSLLITSDGLIFCKGLEVRGGGAIGIRDKNETLRLYLSDTGLAVADESTAVRIIMGHEENKTFLGFYDKSIQNLGPYRILMSTDDTDNTSSIGLYNKTGTFNRVKIMVDEEDNGHILSTDKDNILSGISHNH